MRSDHGALLPLFFDRCLAALYPLHEPGRMLSVEVKKTFAGERQSSRSCTRNGGRCARTAPREEEADGEALMKRASHHQNEPLLGSANHACSTTGRGQGKIVKTIGLIGGMSWESS